jgi:hypothetical protein
MPTVSLEDAVALLYIERNRDRDDQDPLIEKLRDGLSPEAKRIASRMGSSHREDLDFEGNNFDI